jgi:hypothetical protein
MELLLFFSKILDQLHKLESRQQQAIKDYDDTKDLLVKTLGEMKRIMKGIHSVGMTILFTLQTFHLHNLQLKMF